MKRKHVGLIIALIVVVCIACAALGALDPGKMVLIDGDGLGSGGEPAAVPSKEELMSDPEVLKSFINFCVQYAPAEKYDLILWDHGGGPTYGFGMDEHEVVESFWDDRSLMSFPQIMDALSDNDVTKDGGKLDLVDFDACLMSSVELDLVLADYTDYYIPTTLRPLRRPPMTIISRSGPRR